MTNVEFHILESAEGDMAYQQLIGQHIQEHYRQSRKIYIQAKDQEQAEAIDEWLWSQELSDFIPHNLVGEGPNKPPPVQIGFTEPPENQHDVLINLCDQVQSFFSYFLTCIEIVPNNDQAKEEARLRYKYYRSHGYPLKHQKH
ncbi:DNA polymerase III subunit chi [Kangiella sp. TOML190]|uniref:DNA polymerase III subunit chi n=1 Tax=Kangiella sp. TOML190 TaxID=2931351 RepID=UPI0020417927|nr:DNA polymerase III subunit chi [Kangiella sp. TOML190]